MTKTKNMDANYCYKCIEPLMHYGEILVRCYETICEYYADNEHAMPIDEFDAAPGTLTMVKFLEMKGYVVTTELVRDAIVVKPVKPRLIRHHGILYCNCPEKHFPKEGSVHD